MKKQAVEVCDSPISGTCAETKRRWRTARQQNRSKTTSSPRSHCTKHFRWTLAKEKAHTEERQKILPSRSWRALRWRRWRGCHTRIWFWMNERAPLCSSEQTTNRAARNCTRKEREGSDGLGEERAHIFLMPPYLSGIFLSICSNLEYSTWCGTHDIIEF